MSDILAKILTEKRGEVAALDLLACRRAAASAPPTRDFVAALRAAALGGPGVAAVALIAELKRASPSKGLLAPKLDLMQVAAIYAENGAAAVSVVTDEKFFKGDLETLRRLRHARDFRLPLLRKDFIIDEVQLFETRASGADAVLLIAAALPDDARLAALHALALDLGLAPLVEVHDNSEVERALLLEGVNLIGINHRDLTSFKVDLGTSGRLRPLIPAGITVVAESGIHTRQDVARLAQAGIQVVLVGESLITATDIARKVRELSGPATHVGAREVAGP
jgi:indole-3-glycerol phosphate synthase